MVMWKLTGMDFNVVDVGGVNLEHVPTDNVLREF